MTATYVAKTTATTGAGEKMSTEECWMPGNIQGGGQSERSQTS